MADITCCKGNGCPKKHSCQRYLSANNAKWQSYFMAEPYNPKTKTCEYYWHKVHQAKMTSIKVKRS
jgi:hypothetical protein